MSLEIYCDGLCEPRNPGGYACCAFVVFRDGERVHERYACIGQGEGMTNNVAEYRAVRAALRWLVQNRNGETAKVMTDSKLVVEQVNGTWNCNSETLRMLRDDCREAMRATENVLLLWIPRAQNEEADRLTRIAYAEARRAA
jgi:ribonuclease HI